MLLMKEEFVNVTKGHRFGGGEPYEPWTEDVGKLFRTCQREYGRCVSSVYVDQKEGPSIRVGWVFQKMDRYEDTGKPYLRETWITLYEQADEVVRTHHYRKL